MWVCDCDYTGNSKEKIMNNIVDDNFRRGFIFSQILFNAQNGKMESQVVKENGNVVLSRGDYMGEYTMRKITFLFLCF